ncbi:MAG: SDR family oxidoreductase [Clostridia bacterium]|nr:SDR family oxidoreductase [Clostridia bacterium]
MLVPDETMAPNPSCKPASFSTAATNGKRVALITGGSGGIGRETAQLFAARGFIVYELSRSGVSNGPITHITADVTDEASVASALSEIHTQTGRIDVLVNNAGFGISGAVEHTSLADMKRQFDVNFFGLIAASKAALPYLKRSAGRIVNVSSVAAVLPIPFQSMYSASKAAINALTLALRNEVAPFGVSVCAVMPGDVKTGFTAAREKVSAQNSDYESRIVRSVASMEHDEQAGMSPACVAKSIYRAATESKPRPLRVVGGKYRLFTLLAKFFPAGLINWLVGKMYG